MSIKVKDTIQGNVVGSSSTSVKATQLTTARNINGTSFNGTGDITTTKWGTSRTLTVGSTGKSVDGSGNVSWSLSEIGAAPASHTHNYAGSSSAGGVANSAAKLSTARTISLTGDVTGSASFDGSANASITATVADNSHTHDKTTVTSMNDECIAYPGNHISGNISAIDAAHSYLHSANRLQFAKPAGIIVEYSTDGGSTWADYGLTDAQKVALVSGLGHSVRIGKSGTVTVNHKLRITLHAANMGLYTSARSLLVNVSTQGAGGCNVVVEKANRGSETTFRSWFSAQPVNGWSGWNRIPLQGTSFGGGANQTGNMGAIRLTFGITSLSSNYNNQLQVFDIMLFGHTYWSYPSNMAKTGHLYGWDSSQNAIFPAKVTATEFSGSGASLTTLNASNISSGTINAARLPDASTSAKGAMTTAMVTKLNGIATGATAVTTSTVSGWGYTKNTGTVTSVATGVGLTGGTITGSGTLKAKLKSETASTLDSAAMGTTASRQYAVGVDKSGYLSVNIPWSNTTYSANNGVSLSGTTFSHADTSTLSGAYGPSADVTGNDGNTIVIPQITVDGYGHVTGVTNRTYTSKNTTYSSLKNPNALTVKYNGTSSYTYDGSAAKTLNIKAGSNVTVTGDTSGNITIASSYTNTTYSAGSGISFSGTTINHASSITAGTAGTSSATSGSTLAVPYVTYNATGHITAAGTHTHTISGFATSSQLTSLTNRVTALETEVSGAQAALTNLESVVS